MTKKQAATTSRLVPLREAADLLHLNESTIRKGLAGTAELTKIRQGVRVYLLRDEVDAHIAFLIETAKAKRGKAVDRLWQ
jgi:hypothetical protein